MVDLRDCEREDQGWEGSEGRRETWDLCVPDVTGSVLLSLIRAR